jgi:hypothetical protein
MFVLCASYGPREQAVTEENITFVLRIIEEDNRVVCRITRSVLGVGMYVISRIITWIAWVSGIKKIL